MSVELETRKIERRGLQAVDVAVVAVLLAVGAVLRMFVPPFAGITPNFIIGMYCLAILLLRPLTVGLLALPKLERGLLKAVRPFVITYLGTAVSGFSYVGAMIYLLTASGKNAPAFAALSSVVVITALANSILVSVLYFPLKAALGRNSAE